MKRRILTATVIAATIPINSGAAWADAGAPGWTFPEQPGSHPATACSAVASNPGTAAGGAFDQNGSATATVILAGLYADVCLSG